MSKTIDIEYDHYKDTVSKQNSFCSKRDKYFTQLLLLLLVQTLLINYSDSIFNSLFEYIKSNYGVNLILPANIITSFIWLLMLLCTVRYIRTVLIIETNYLYIHNLEDRLMKQKVHIFREGKNYYSIQSPLKNIIKIIYQTLIPVLYIIIAIIKICFEWYLDSFCIFSIIDSIICIFCVIIMIKFYCFINEDKDKKKYK